MAGQIGAAWAILRKDLAVWLHSPAVVATTLLPPLVLLLILGLAAVAVTTQPVAVVNLDGGGAAARVMERTAIDFEGFRAGAMSSVQADQAFAGLGVSAVLTIPAGFSADLAAGRRPAFQVRNFNEGILTKLGRVVKEVAKERKRYSYRRGILKMTGKDPLRGNKCEVEMWLLMVYHPKYGVPYEGSKK